MSATTGGIKKVDVVRSLKKDLSREREKRKHIEREVNQLKGMIDTLKIKAAL